MEFLQSVLEFFSAHGTTVLEVAGVVLGTASLITGLTKTPKDDGVVAFLQKVVRKLSLLTHTDETGTIKAPLLEKKDK